MSKHPESSPSTEPILRLTGISKQFPGVKALDNVDFYLVPGEVHALMGENGAGKSTLINIISGLLQPTTGKIHLDGREVTFTSSIQAKKAGISTITQEFNLVPELTVAENMFLAHEPTLKTGLINWREIRGRAQDILAELGLSVPLNQRVAYLSVGDRQLVEIGKALSLEFRMITMDEPTAALNAAEVERLFEIVAMLKRRNVGILYVSHHLNEIFQIADRVTVLRDGKHVATQPLNELTEDKVVTMMLGRALQKRAMVKEDVSEAEGLALSVENIEVPGSLSGISFGLRFREVMGFAGLIGSGRSELTRALFGLLPISQGQVKVDGKLASLKGPKEALGRGIFLLPEERKVEGIFPALTVLENLMISGKRTSQVFINPGAEQEQYEKLRGSMSLRAASSSQGIAKLSGGNQQKVMLGRALVSNSRILLLNEPTRGVDVGAKMEIHAIIRDLARNGYAVIVSSSDIPELVSVSDRCLVLHGGRIKGTLNKAEINEDNITAMAIGQDLSEDRK